MEFKSEGMMQGAELAAEALSIQAAYQANLAKIREAEARGEVSQLGVGLTNEEIWGHGPGGHRSVLERVKASVSEPIGRRQAAAYVNCLLEAGHTLDEIESEIPLLQKRR